MEEAIKAVKENKMGWLLASKTYGVPQATLRRHALGLNKTLTPNTKGLGRFKITFPPEIERQLVTHLKLLETRLFGLTRTEVQELAFQLAQKNGFPHTFNAVKQTAGQEWLAGFLRRNKDISVRKPEPTSAARAQAFNRPQVTKFFNAYEELIITHKFPPNRIYNVDESALSTVQRPQKILATTGRKQVGCLTSAERGSHLTVVCCMNAAGTYVPPCMIFPRKNMKNELLDEAPTGTIGIAQETGWMNADIFVKWLRHFQSYAKASVDEKVLLVVDGHASHKGIDCLSYAKENGIVILCLPPHCTHRMQPLDVCFYGPLKTYFNQEITKWLKAHPGRVVTHLQIGGLFNKAYGKTATVENACQGFKSTGLWPVDADIFPDHLFEPAETTNIPLTSETIPDAQTLTTHDSQQTTTARSTSPKPRSRSTITLEEEAHILATQSNLISSIAKSPSPQPGPSGLSVSLETLRPIPRGKFVSGQGKRKPKSRETCLLLTSTPNMDEIKDRQSNKNPTEKRKRKVTKVLFDDDSDEEVFAVECTEDEEDCPCIYCNDLFSRSKPGEGWLRCMLCSRWAHASCADLPKSTKKFVCELCV